MTEPLALRELMAWYVEAGVDETIDTEPTDHYALAVQPEAPAEHPPVPAPPAGSLPPHKPPARPPSVGPVGSASAGPPPGTEAAVGEAHGLAASADSVEALHAILKDFDGCALKKTATNLCFADGNPKARIMLVGEGPGEEEDRQGRPFVGPSGRLLDRMLASIGLDRTDVLISNTVFWRPPGNRTPTSAEMAVCLPFVERLIEIVMPEVMVALGGAAAKAVLGRQESVGRLRRQWFPYSSPGLSRPVQATVVYHPSYLLRSPAEKRKAWQDLLALRAYLDESGRS